MSFAAKNLDPSDSQRRCSCVIVYIFINWEGGGEGGVFSFQPDQQPELTEFGPALLPEPGNDKCVVREGTLFHWQHSPSWDWHNCGKAFFQAIF